MTVGIRGETVETVEEFLSEEAGFGDGEKESMYNNVGIRTPRGSGTSGHVMSNRGAGCRVVVVKLLPGCPLNGIVVMSCFSDVVILCWRCCHVLMLS